MKSSFFKNLGPIRYSSIKEYFESIPININEDTTFNEFTSIKNLKTHFAVGKSIVKAVDGVSFDLKSGKGKWLKDDFGSVQNQNIIPISDPVISDGLIYVLIWNSNGGQKLELACFEEVTQSLVWTSTIAQAGKSSDIIGNLEKARQEIRSFGNRVSLSGGSIYINSNAGLIARCDPRDGKPDWIHYYSNSPSPGAGALGCSPIINGDLVVCMTKDSGKIFALDSQTGKVVWENTLALGIEYLGMNNESLIIRGQFSLAAIDLKKGETIWHTKISERIIGRSQMIGSSIYLAKTSGIIEFDANSGAMVNSVEWDKDVGPVSYTHLTLPTILLV